LSGKTVKRWSHATSRFEIPAMRHGESQAVETLISEDASLLARYLRNEKNAWVPRAPTDSTEDLTFCAGPKG